MRERKKSTSKKVCTALLPWPDRESRVQLRWFAFAFLIKWLISMFIINFIKKVICPSARQSAVFFCVCVLVFMRCHPKRQRQTVDAWHGTKEQNL